MTMAERFGSDGSAERPARASVRVAVAAAATAFDILRSFRARLTVRADDMGDPRQEFVRTLDDCRVTGSETMQCG